MEQNQVITKYAKDNQELRECLSWIMDCYKCTLASKPVRNLDEVFSYADSLLAKKPNNTEDNKGDN